MSTQKQLLLLSASAILMAACASGGVQVSSTWDPLAPFPKQATYAWDDAASKLPPDASLQSLGLPTARRIIEEHGGHLTVHSEHGRGSDFVVQLKQTAC